MKSKMALIVLSCSFLLFTTQAQAGFFSSLIKSIVKIVSHVPIIGNIVENEADRYAHRKLNSEIDRLANNARSCASPEKDGQLGIVYWLAQKPGFPGWEDIDKLKSRSDSYVARGKSFASYDKVQHCYVGCTIRKELGHGSAVLAGWLKELKDISDCSASTHFDIEDNEATVGGAIAGGKTSCESFCGRSDFKSASGSYILEAAQELQAVHIGSSGGGGNRSRNFKIMQY